MRSVEASPERDHSMKFHDSREQEGILLHHSMTVIEHLAQKLPAPIPKRTVTHFVKISKPAHLSSHRCLVFSILLNKHKLSQNIVNASNI